MEDKDLNNIEVSSAEEPKTDEDIQKSKRDFGLGIYGSKKNISLKLLDGFIVLLIIAIAAVLVFFWRLLPRCVWKRMSLKTAKH